MDQFIASVIVISIIFALCFAAMAVGLMVRGRKMRGGCGSHGHSDKKEEKEHSSCGFCAEKKKLNICSAENKGAVKDVSKLNTLGRFEE